MVACDPESIDGEIHGMWIGDLALDLTDATGRYHAAFMPGVSAFVFSDEGEAMIGTLIAEPNPIRSDQGALWDWWLGDDCPDEYIEALRRIVLHVAGREATP